MWKGVYPAVTTKFDERDALDHPEMARCFRLQIDAGCDGLIVCGSLGEGSMLTREERFAVLATAMDCAEGRPVLMTVAEAATRDACRMAEQAARHGASGLMVVPSPIYHTDPRETVGALRAVAAAGDLPVMIYSNRVAYRVDVTTDILAELADDRRICAIKESSDDIRRTTEIINRLGDRYAVLTGVDNLALEALTMGAVGWVAGLVTAFPQETVAIYRLVAAGRVEAARKIYRWFRPLLDLDVSTYLVQNIKLVEALVIGSNDRVRLPRLPLSGARRETVTKLVREALERRPSLAETIALARQARP